MKYTNRSFLTSSLHNQYMSNRGGRGGGGGGGRGRGGGGRGGGRGGASVGSIIVRSNAKKNAPRRVSIGGGGHNGGGMEETVVTIGGLPMTSDPIDVIDFLKNKAYKPNMHVKTHYYKNQKLVLQLEKPEDVVSLLGVSGSRYIKDKLIITRGEGSGPGNNRIRQTLAPSQQNNHKSAMKEKITEINAKMIKIEKHITATYQKDSPMLDLSYLASGHGVDMNDPKIIRPLLRIITDKFPKANTISFAHNNITTLAPYSTISKFKLDHIVNYSFDSNNLNKFSELDQLSELPLRELLLSNNPISSLPNYRMEVARRFPDMNFLDSVPIGPSDFPPSPIPPLRPSFFETPDRQQFALRFLEKYFTSFDKKRVEISNAYFGESKFSMTFSSSESNHRGTSKTYIRQNRNLIKSPDLIKKTNLLIYGSEKITDFFKIFPITVHNLESFVVDVFFVPPAFPGAPEALYVITHGHFTEASFFTKRSFDRTFVLVPAQPGSESAKNGWEAVILNEQLNVRPYIRSPRLVSLDGGEPTAPIAATPNGVAGGANQPPANEAEIIQQLMTMTSLNNQFAKDCLVNSGWDLNIAFTTFQMFKSQGKIPDHCYTK
ncbi:hypothetical protein DFA_04663 [Cavenderia fasciculata]|uniref:Nuclear RNA export factor 1 n=1 Tax=Cavenderia fasciculata TaxID=261658 RepID=F4PQ71_CACFS|nr:uncharacterized protein DFA_04663 [Cavenderia fasciculata]EGG22534.1 hypothetical protein DFA_04663 [Cavenderia fasciculata]|eukprot:XP_004360385.1 hypothetical protein DFA_04663 [Cavenderia fasciculata]